MVSKPLKGADWIMRQMEAEVACRRQMQWAETHSELIRLIEGTLSVLPSGPGGSHYCLLRQHCSVHMETGATLVPLWQLSIHLMLTTPCPDPGPACHHAGKQRSPSGFRRGPPHNVSLAVSSVLAAVDMNLFPACILQFLSGLLALLCSPGAPPARPPASPCPPSSPLQCLSFLHSRLLEACLHSLLSFLTSNFPSNPLLPDSLFSIERLSLR